MDSLTIPVIAFNEEKHNSFVEHFYQKLHDNWNILIIDDGSSDGTREVLNDMEKNYPKLKVISHELNKGIGNF